MRPVRRELLIRLPPKDDIKRPTHLLKHHLIQEIVPERLVPLAIREAAIWVLLHDAVQRQEREHDEFSHTFHISSEISCDHF